MKTGFLILSITLLATPVLAQTAPLTTEQIQAQSQATIQNSANALDRSMNQVQQSQVQQQQQHDQLFGPAYPAYPAYTPPPAPPPPAQPKK